MNCGGMDERGFWIPGLASLARNDEEEKPPARDNEEETARLAGMTPLFRHPGRRAAPIRDPGMKRTTAAWASVGSGFRVSLRSPGMTKKKNRSPGMTKKKTARPKWQVKNPGLLALASSF